jgi:Zn-dependent alcohol dehydrogenase
VKAAVCRKFGAPLEIEDVALDPPSGNEVKVRIKACAICHSDLHLAAGEWGGGLPAIYGHEAAGVVEEIGEHVRNLKVGDPVVVTLIRSCGTCPSCEQGNYGSCETRFPLDQQSPLRAANDGETISQGLRTGAFAEYALVESSQVVAVPDDLPFDRAALLACGVITGFGAVANTAKVPEGASVVVIGTGGVGLNSVQGAVICGARTIIAVDVSDTKLEAARRFGATHGLNSAKVDLRKRVTALTDQRGADFVFVTVGAKEAADQAYTLLAPSGTAVMVGLPALGVKSEFDVLIFTSGSRRILGSTMGASNIQTDIPKLIDLYRQGRLELDGLITARYPLEEINEAIASVHRGEAIRNIIEFP